ncbi:MAG TPA: hypothetical protein VIV11_12700 [Kofleriaceae bacterium]
MSRLTITCVALVCAISCKSEPAKTRAKKAADAKEFWPDAPKPTIKTGTRTFRYNPANLGPYHMFADGGSTDSPIAITFKMILDLDFRAADAPTERNVHMTMLDMWMKAGPAKMVMRVNSNEFYFEQGEEKTSIKLGDKDSPFDVAELTTRPLSIFTFDADGTVRVRANPDHPFETVGGGGAEDMLESALVLFPNLPPAPIAPGHRWTVMHNTQLGTSQTRVDVEYAYEYVGDGACPSGTGTCSLLSFTASSPGVDATTETGIKVNAAYGFAGKVFFSHDRGIIDESRVRADIDIKSDQLSMQLGVTYSVKPG